MSKPFAVISLILAVVALIFHFAHLAAEFQPVLGLGALLCLSIGVLRGE